MGKKIEYSQIKKAAIGEPFVTFCVVRSKEVKYKQNGQPYLVLELGDQSGRLKTRLWNDIDSNSAETPVGGIVKIQAVAEAVNGRKELKIQRLRAASAEDKISADALLPQTAQDVAQLRQMFDAHRQSITNTHLLDLLSAVFRDEAFAKAYFRSPGGKLWHHNYLSGMLEHVVKLLNFADLMNIHYPEIDIDLLKTAIICHDLGKVREYSLNGYIDFSTEGRLLGNGAIGYGIIDGHIRDLPEFPPDLRQQLLHLVLSHNGKQHGAPVEPMTLEAMVLQHLILLDAHTNAILRIRENDVLPDQDWSKYIPLLERFIYAGKQA